MVFTEGMIKSMKRDKKRIQTVVEMSAVISSVSETIKETFYVHIIMNRTGTEPEIVIINGLDMLSPVEDEITPEEMNAYFNAFEVYKEFMPQIQEFYDGGGSYFLRRQWLL
ncbi:hypothetical protein [Alkalicoccus daliensis]|uniref:Uncharacterized protein n=1 Tax=Alkalicoccus daliensis TaxID=745820 RepID=A0A1H0GFE1_9BACI|nr:hypothetical protein [Alkalicoccus daliensis]SDO05647.1 hypothetical protein SAMN04488053_10689 [Alkalicoccus daliensis]